MATDWMTNHSLLTHLLPSCKRWLQTEWQITHFFLIHLLPSCKGWLQTEWQITHFFLTYLLPSCKGWLQTEWQITHFFLTHLLPSCKGWLQTVNDKSFTSFWLTCCHLVRDGYRLWMTNHSLPLDFLLRSCKGWLQIVNDRSFTYADSDVLQQTEFVLHVWLVCSRDMGGAHFGYTVPLHKAFHDLKWFVHTETHGLTYNSA
jgi:hypothetical protein